MTIIAELDIHQGPPSMAAIEAARQNLQFKRQVNAVLFWVVAMALAALFLTPFYIEPLPEKTLSVLMVSFALGLLVCGGIQKFLVLANRDLSPCTADQYISAREWLTIPAVARYLQEVKDRELVQAEYKMLEQAAEQASLDQALHSLLEESLEGARQ